MNPLTRVCLSLCVLLIYLGFLSFIKPNSVIAGNEKNRSETIKEEVPFDRPVDDIVKYLAPMNESKLFKSLEISSCTECHDEEWETNPERRELDEPHDEIPGKFINHDSKNRWCLDCHSTNNRDKLRLINGNLIDFKEYYKLCAECHRKIFREWKMGVHGKTTGYWNGIKEYRHCTQCHNPHNPPFKPLVPEPPPVRPENLGTISTRVTK